MTRTELLKWTMERLQNKVVAMLVQLLCRSPVKRTEEQLVAREGELHLETNLERGQQWMVIMR